MRKRTLFFVLSALFLGIGLSANAQKIAPKDLLENVDVSLSNINTVVYKVDYFNKYLAKHDTLHSTAICSLYRMPKDKMGSYHRIDLEFDVEKDAPKYFGQRIYNGEKVLYYSNVADSLTTDEKPDIFSEKRKKYAVVENYSNFLLKQYFGKKNSLETYGTKLMKLFIKDIYVTEEKLHNTPVYVVNIAFKDQKDTTRDQLTKHYIRKSDFLPIAYYSFLRWENMEQYNYYEIDYLAINTGVSKDDFKIEENQSLNATELYKDFKNQLKKTNDVAKN